ncbi:GNAT family N-acetyltransferase [Mesorhizobium sp.]|uniref:GNAT family N-acetyltransferase n=1 Tax=Mesorhizobium sp. TaxID=1871066 RepID=UPI000FE51E19|nr:GNAT family N-acetyltransferase [Mesorhizobium sp.]RWP51305.1 MAG: GNAT family N-acetyltransferase [Mesorhizobium sp.]
MTDEVTIRELNGLDEMLSIYPVFRQGNSHLDEAAFRERLSAILAQGNYRCIAAYIGDRLVGLSGFWTGIQIWCGKYIEADHVVVDTTLRSLGTGTKLMAWIEAEGERTGCAVFRIAMVLGKERTRQFYARNGFFDDGLLMVKALSRGAAEFPAYVSRPAEPGLRV